MKKTRFVVLVLVVLICFLFINFQKSSLSNICNNVFGLNDYNVISVSKNDDYSGILLLLQLLMIIKKYIRNINKMLMLLGVNILIGVVQWQKMAVVLLL